ncbi:MAG: hypothetical protein A2309_02875 [Bacteroidetes bacterium RIFOXYB2_FULL_35_7]|nr:MAG: hypothetical protein A2309_02875 [Bacteroidetes bacterium RIFOXYB2_FULL_35_7]
MAQPSSNDFNPKEIAKTIDQHQVDLSEIKNNLGELDGKKLDDKICKAIKDSTHIQKEIENVVWKTIKDKIIWIILTLLALLTWDVVRSWAINFLPKH